VTAQVRARTAFTLVEIMIVVAIVGLLATMAIGSMVKARKQSQGNRILNDVSMLDDAITEWAINANAKDGDPIDWTTVATYLKKPIVFSDILGNPYEWNTVGSNQIGLSWNTKAELAGVGIDWGLY
jgi:prepilin-type N-terminal cleavage/methylation domain-containing protein